MEKTELMPENVLKFSTINDNDQHPDILPDRDKVTGIDSHWFPF